MITFNLNASDDCTWILSAYLYHDEVFENAPTPTIGMIRRLIARDPAAYPSWLSPNVFPCGYPFSGRTVYDELGVSNLPLRVNVDGETMYGYLCQIAPYINDCICTIHQNGSRSAMIVCSEDCKQSLFYRRSDAIENAKRLESSTAKIRRRLAYIGGAENFLNNVDKYGDELLDAIKQFLGVLDINDDITADVEFAELFKQKQEVK